MIESTIYFVLRFIRAVFGFVGAGVVLKLLFNLFASFSQVVNTQPFDPTIEALWFVVGFGLFFILRFFIHYIHKKRNDNQMHPSLISYWHI